MTTDEIKPVALAQPSIDPPPSSRQKRAMAEMTHAEADAYWARYFHDKTKRLEAALKQIAPDWHQRECPEDAPCDCHEETARAALA